MSSQPADDADRDAWIDAQVAKAPAPTADQQRLTAQVLANHRATKAAS